MGDPRNVSVCGLYGSVLWYADDLALRASRGFAQYQRQDLVGGRYSLVGVGHDNEALLTPGAPVTLHADFWVNFLWKRLVGTGVLKATVVGGGRTVRGYAHCGQGPSRFAPGVMPEEQVTFVLINLENSTDAAVALDPAPSAYTAWTLGPTAAGAFGAGALLNGQELPATVADGATIDEIPVPGVGREGSAAATVTLPPISVTFVMANGLAPGWKCSDKQ